MSMHINSLGAGAGGIAPVTPLSPDLSASKTDGLDFQSILKGAVNEVESSSKNAKTSVDRFLAGESDDLHSTALALQRADLEFDLFMQVRNKVIGAYQEVMRMQI